MPRHYLFFASHAYSYTILRPLQAAIRRRGDDVAWYLEPSCPDLLLPEEQRLHTLGEVKSYNPVAVFAPGNYIYFFFPGVKVEVFHGYPINKRNDSRDDHFRLRGWFDLYCTQGPSSTPIFKEMERKDGSFKVYETGWSKADSYVLAAQRPATHDVPTIFVATTFSKRITALRTLFPVIRRLAEQRPWNWVVTMHPKLSDEALKADLTELARSHDNVTFYPVTPPADVLAQTDVMLCDASSIILEYMLLDKPVVTYRNTTPGPHLMDVRETKDVEAALEKAMTRPQALLDAMRQYRAFHEAHADGCNCDRILEAVDDFVLRHQGRLKRKPLNLFRKFKQLLSYYRQKPQG